VLTVADDPYSSPLAYFSKKLKRLRERAGMTQAQIAVQTNYALSTVSAYETGTRIPSSDFAKLADKVFGTGPESEDDEGELEGLQKLVETVSVRPWFRDRVEVERKSAEIREYESYQIPGLLQTEDYARAIMSVARPKLPSDEIERAMALRMTRQEILEPRDGLPADQEQSPRYWAIMDESILHRVVGGPEIMQVQRTHLAEMAQRPYITIQIITDRKGPTSAYGRAFAILVSQNNSSVIYLEDPNSAHYVRDRDDVNRYALIFDHLRASALDAQTIRLLKGEEI
jgi:transcriptional regulator with XRE-family HTH domain